MSKQSRRGKIPSSSQTMRVSSVQQPERSEPDPTSLQELPVTYQSLINYVERAGSINSFVLRRETFLRIEQIT